MVRKEQAAKVLSDQGIGAWHIVVYIELSVSNEGVMICKYFLRGQHRAESLLMQDCLPPQLM